MQIIELRDSKSGFHCYLFQLRMAAEIVVITKTAAAANPNATRVFDIGCGAGNYTLKVL